MKSHKQPFKMPRKDTDTRSFRRNYDSINWKKAKPEPEEEPQDFAPRDHQRLSR